MAFTENINQLQKDSFIEVDNTPARRVFVVGGDSGLLSGVTYDSIVASYPDTDTEVYTYKSGGLSGTTVAVIEVIYTDSTKEVLDSVERTS